MVGPFNTPEVPAQDAEAIASAPEKRGLAALLSTTVGKVVVGGIAVALVLAALGIIAVVFVFSDGQDPDVVITPPTSADASSTLEPEPVRRPDPSPSDVFTFRNIFQPTAKPAVTVTSEASDAESGTIDGIEVPEDTLYLQAVAVEDNEEVATFIWNGQKFTAPEGARLGDTPWRVISISGNTVEMLYGDSRVTLVVGQGLGK